MDTSLSLAPQDEMLEAHMDLTGSIRTVIEVIDRFAREEEGPQ